MRLAPALGIARGMVNGDTRGSPRAYSPTNPSSSVDLPPPDDPITMAARSGSENAIPDRADGAHARGHTLPERVEGVAERGNHAHAGNRYAARHAGPDGPAFAASSLSMPATISRMDRISRAASSGMSMLNSPSIANRIL